MVTKVTARLGMIVVLAALFTGAPASVGAATQAAHAKPGVGDPCLIGTYRARPSRVGVEFHHHIIKMHYGGGDWLHVYRSGVEIDHFDRSRILEAFPNGLPLKMHIRGTYVAHLRGVTGSSDANGDNLEILHATDRQWAAGSYIHATYNGKPVKFVFHQLHSGYGAYTCSDRALIEIDNELNVQQTYARHAFAP